MADRKKLHVQCPCCSAKLTLDAASGEVLFTEQPVKKGVSFDDALKQVRRQKETASARFDEAFQKEKSRKDLIDLKFKEAMERADELEAPLRDIDLE
jgi:hypothetical protein